MRFPINILNTCAAIGLVALLFFLSSATKNSELIHDSTFALDPMNDAPIITKGKFQMSTNLSPNYNWITIMDTETGRVKTYYRNRNGGDWKLASDQTLGW